MALKDSINIIAASGLDRHKWDDCVQRQSCLIYSYSWYLDAIAEDWYGLVAGNYEMIMPLPVKRKLGITMLAIPPFIQRTDSSSFLPPEIRSEVVAKIISFARIVHLNLSDPEFFPAAKKRVRTNFILDLNKPYASIFDKFTPQCQKNLRKAAKRGCLWSGDLSINDVIRLYRLAYEQRSSYDASHYQKLEKLLTVAMEKGFCRLGAVRDEQGDMVYAGLMFDDGKRLYYLLGAPTEKGRQMRATYFFIDQMIQKYAGTARVLDFEGSDIPDVAKFYSSFSPAIEHYYEYYLNRYPFPLRNILDRKLKPF